MKTLNEVVDDLVSREILNRDEILTLLRSVYADNDADLPVFVQRLYLWAEGIKQQSLLLDMVLKGALSITFTPEGDMKAGMTQLAATLQEVLDRK